MTKGKKPGARPGNKNALKHGLYSQFIVGTDVAGLKGMSDISIADELALARINLKNAQIHGREATSRSGKLSWDFAAHYWLETIVNAKIKAKEREETAGQVWETLIDAVRESNDKQGVKK